MNNTTAVAWKEIKAYFQTPTAYVVGAMFLILTGIFFVLDATGAFAQASVTGFVVRATNFSILLAPLLTMRLLSEEQKLGTMELLLTAPIRDWEVVVGSGHCPEHICLYNKKLRLFISGDQVLPKITSNVSVFPTEPNSNPLNDWIESCKYIKSRVNNDVLVLPSHNEPFRGLHERLDHLINGHERNLTRLLEFCEEPKRAVDVFSVLFKRKITSDVLLMATGESIAHLNCLIHRGLLGSKHDDEGIIRYYKL